MKNDYDDTPVLTGKQQHELGEMLFKYLQANGLDDVRVALVLVKPTEGLNASILALGNMPPEDQARAFSILVGRFLERVETRLDDSDATH